MRGPPVSTPFWRIWQTAFLPCLASLLLTAGCSTGPRGLPAVGSVGNFGKVDGRVYRGAQPDKAGLKSLKELGVATIVNLRRPGDVWAGEEDLARTFGFQYFNVPMSGYARPSAASVESVLAIIEDSPGPVFVHCQHGCDRTGAVIACYRIRHDGWNSRQALDEARIHGMSPWEIFMRGFVDDFGKAAESARP